MYILRYAVNSFMVYAVLSVAPVERSSIEIAYIPKGSAYKEIILYKPDEAFNRPFCKRMPGLTQLCLKADCLHKRLVIFLPYWLSGKVSLYNDAPHIIC